MAGRRPAARGADMTVLRCHAYRRGQRWHAICLDLDIAVDGESLPAVVASLQTCIDMHVERAAELPAEERGRFLTRRAPWRVTVSLAIAARLHRLQGVGGRYARSFLPAARSGRREGRRDS